MQVDYPEELSAAFICNHLLRKISLTITGNPEYIASIQLKGLDLSGI